MPCVLRSEEDIARWLDLGETPQGWVDGKGGTADVLQSEPGLDVYPVLPEVGKIGQSKHAYILPVAERKDGIKSFFAKQNSPVKPKAEPKATPKPTAEAKAETFVKAEPATPTTSKPKAEPTSEVKASQEKPASQESKPAASQEVTEVGDSEDEKPSKRKAERQGGRRTKVSRPVPEAKKDQKSITSFFKSPRK
ncbi:hypothetical protein A1Q1_07630 [Trichosporon asahii var. asahii CBS 2479]|uniref:Uncharacterized protein n=1 Tax=Trichosporon asahii var. asahii (strain ATCC 90039 / CBS 2479 / JCM 2466 / KCTC 7840 / NBRC 103889/ NCYC 2677 / UAMH 7654) TaxID=1186058 RepID=J5TJ41_TRIAS|nr:hypothetical protein A1Q1_07630 [Trichosporon asahii var. asahii CBS 2479]EJT51166.1 hypothetical protein A1Q1_07630 [Trichosporon asahii var. asahii CBS 2479]